MLLIQAMPSTLLFLALGLMGLLSVDGEDHRTTIDNELLSYYTSNSEKLGQQLHDQQFSPLDSSSSSFKGQNLHWNGAEGAWRKPLMRNVDGFSNPLSPAVPVTSDTLFLGPYEEEGLQVDSEGGADDAEPGSYHQDDSSAASYLYSLVKKGGRDGGRVAMFRPSFQNPFLGLMAPGEANSWAWATKEFKRQRVNGGGPSLSVDSSMDVIRQKLVNGLRRNQLLQKQRQIEHNHQLLTSIGKRMQQMASGNSNSQSQSTSEEEGLSQQQQTGDSQ